MACLRKRNGKWQVQIRRSGFSLISRTFLMKEDAKVWARNTEASLDRGEYSPNKLADQSVLFKDLIKKYMDEVSPKKRGGDIECIILRALLRHQLASRQIKNLSANDFANYRDERLKEVSPSTVKRQLNILSHLLSIAIKEWNTPISTNFIHEIEKPLCNGRRERRISHEEVTSLLKASKTCRNIFIKPIIQIALLTGMRRGEILNIHSSHINKDKRTLILPETKNGHSRTIPLSSDAFDVIDAYKIGEGLLFPISANCFRLAWERLKRKTNVNDLRFHDFRHEAISRFFERGLSVPEVALISGHRDYRMLQRYTHLKAEDIVKKL